MSSGGEGKRVTDWEVGDAIVVEARHVGDVALRKVEKVFHDYQTDLYLPSHATTP